MTEWIDVPVSEVQVGDSVRIKGYRDGGLGVCEVVWTGKVLVFHARNLDLIDRRGKR